MKNSLKTVKDIELKLAELVEESTLGSVPSVKATPDRKIIDELGLDSLDYASVMLSCERWLGSKVDERSVNWREIQTLGQLAEVLFRSQENA